METSGSSGEKFQRLVEIMDILRGEQGCPWDKEQDETSIVNYFLEEVYEAVDAVVNKDVSALKEELGDVLMEVVFLSRIFSEKASFSIADVLEGINRKMIRRHPHVFGREVLENSDEVIENWNRQKDREKERRSALEGIPNNLPSLLEAFQIGQRVAGRGFDWDHPRDVLQKVHEELLELEEALDSEQEANVLEELGDLFFSLANLCRHLGINPEIALRSTNKKFVKRFSFVENKIKEQGREGERLALDELDALWKEAKKRSD